MILHFPAMSDALEMVPAILAHKVAAAELMTAPSIHLDFCAFGGFACQLEM